MAPATSIASVIHQLEERVDMTVADQNGVTAEALASVSTPDRVQSRLGTLEFDDGAPSDATAALVYDNLDFQNGVQAIPGVSLTALRQGFLAAGVEDNSFALFYTIDRTVPPSGIGLLAHLRVVVGATPVALPVKGFARQGGPSSEPPLGSGPRPPSGRPAP
jgi:hypothetical protein